jgi:hypothetical protein
MLGIERGLGNRAFFLCGCFALVAARWLTMRSLMESKKALRKRVTVMTQKKIAINTNRIDPYKNFKFRTAELTAEGEPANAGSPKKAAKTAKKAAKKTVGKP